MREQVVEGGGSLKLHVREWGPRDAPAILLLHGWSQHHLCWSRQFDSSLSDEFRAVAPDLRGHGQSEAPLEPENYKTGSLWADDVAALISSLELVSPVLVGWSYGGFVIGDYLRQYGDGAIAGINLAGGAIGIGPDWFGTKIGPDFVRYAPLACSPDQPQALAAIQALVHRFFVRPVAPGELEAAVGWSMLTQPAVRGALHASIWYEMSDSSGQLCGGSHPQAVRCSCLRRTAFISGNRQRLVPWLFVVEHLA